MKHFSLREIKEAYSYAESGGQALHTHNIIVNPSSSPRCFVNAIKRGELIAHLFDQNKERLVKTAKRFGVNVIHIDNEGTPRQHIDLCGVPLRKAMSQCEEDSK